MPELIIEHLASLQIDADIFNTLRMMPAIDCILDLELRFSCLLPEFYFPYAFSAHLRVLLAALSNSMHSYIYSIIIPMGLKSFFDLGGRQSWQCFSFGPM
jgi:hypothetical protein